MTFAESLIDLSSQEYDKKQKAIAASIDSLIEIIEKVIKTEAYKAASLKKSYISGYLCLFGYINAGGQWTLLNNWNDDITTANITIPRGKNRPKLLRIDRICYNKTWPTSSYFDMRVPAQILYNNVNVVTEEYAILSKEDIDNLLSKINQLIISLGFQEFQVKVVKKQFFYYEKPKRSMFGFSNRRKIFDGGTGKGLYLRIYLLPGTNSI